MAGRTGEITVQAGGPEAFGYVPATADTAPLRLVMFLHGAGGDASRSVNVLRPFAEEHRLLLLAPQSTRTTWDVIGGDFGVDVLNIDRLLAKTAARYSLRGYTVAGFSDGASYAVSLGLGNGDVFDSVVAFSPCFSAARANRGRARFFVSHGDEDQILPIDRCSDQLVPQLRRNGYAVTYRRFSGGHEVPEQVKAAAVAWLGDEAGHRG